MGSAVERKGKVEQQGAEHFEEEGEKHDVAHHGANADLFRQRKLRKEDAVGVLAEMVGEAEHDERSERHVPHTAHLYQHQDYALTEGGGCR